MNFKQSAYDDLGKDNDYIILLRDLTIMDTDYNDVDFKAGTVFEIIYTDEDDMEGYYVVELKDGKPGFYVNKDQEYFISLAFQWEQRDKGINNITVVPKSTYEFKHSLNPSTVKSFEELIDEL